MVTYDMKYDDVLMMIVMSMMMMANKYDDYYCLRTLCCCDEGVEVAQRGILHGDVHLVNGLHCLEHPNDVWMLQCAHDCHFVPVLFVH